MARKLPAVLKLALPAYHTVLFDGVPMWRAQAWALLDARLHGVDFTVNSAIRTDSILRKYRGRGLRKGVHGQGFLFVHQFEPGFFPANPPNMTSHCGFSDGNPVFKRPRFAKIPRYMWGIDAVNKPGGDASELVRWLNAHGYHAVRPYNTSSERHHFCFTKSPASNARRRLAAHYAGRKHKR